MSQSSPERRPISPDDVLPPVEPPSAGFIVQLFVVPAVIVLAIVLIWLLFTWVARSGEDPQDYIAGLRRPGPGRWQVASNLANALRDKRFEEFKRNAAAATELAAVLNDELDEGSLEEKPVTLRIFLCRALGEFQTPAALPVLIRAATTGDQPPELEVRRSAVEGIALLAQNIQTATGQPLADPKLDAALADLARHDDSLLRVRTAFALGVLGGDDHLQLLETLLRDGNADVRFNAAVGLARHGRPSAVDTLVEMLDPAEPQGIELETQAEMQPMKRSLILVNALRATRKLIEQNPSADLQPLAAALDQLSTAAVPKPIQVEARTIRALMRP